MSSSVVPFPSSPTHKTKSPTHAMMSPKHALMSPTNALKSPSNASTASSKREEETLGEISLNSQILAKNQNMITSALNHMFQDLYKKDNMMELKPTSVSEELSTQAGVRNYPFQYGLGYDLTPKPITHRITIDPNLFPSGKDHGHGGEDVIKTYLNNVVNTNQPKRQQHVQLKRLTEEFKSLTFEEQLEHVELRNIPNESAIAIQQSLLPNHSSDAKKFFIMLTTKLKENDATLVRLRLSNMAITDFILQQLCKGICRNTFLQYLQLHNNKITDHGIEALCSALRWHPTCHSIWLGNNRITDVGARHLALLCHRNPVITELNLANKWPNATYAGVKEVELHPYISHVGVQYLCNQLSKMNSQLTSLSLANQRIRDQGAMMLFEIMQSTTLRSLNLSSNEITNNIGTPLQEMLQKNPILEELILSKNKIADEAVIEIAAGLAYNSNLSTLDVSYNEIHIKGLYALYQCLQYNTTLTSLITVGNHATDERAENLVANRSRSIFVFPNQYPLIAAQQRKKSMLPDTIKELRASLCMNPEEEMKKEDPPPAPPILYQSPSQSPLKSGSSKKLVSRKSYGSFSEFAQSPFKSTKRNSIVNQPTGEGESEESTSEVDVNNVIATSNGIESHGRKRRMKSVLNTMELMADDNFSIKEGDVDEEQEDDDSIQMRVRAKLQTANKKTRGGPMNIQDAIATAVSIVEEIEREDQRTSTTESNKIQRPAPIDVSSPSLRKRKNLKEKTSPNKDQSPSKSRKDNSSPSKTEDIDISSKITPTSDISARNTPVSNKKRSKKKKKVRLEADKNGEDDDGSVGGESSVAGDDVDDNLSATSVKSAESAESNSSIKSRNENSSKAGKSLNELMRERRSNPDRVKGLGSRGSALVTTSKAPQPPVKVNPFELSSEERQKYFNDNIPVFKEGQLTTKPNRRLSQDYGKTLGVPQLKSMGVRPIRTSISTYADSGQHLMYLRVATEDDPEEARPYSVIKIGLDKRAERERVRKARQTEEYKLAKLEKLAEKPKEKPQTAASSRVPEKFWRNWRMRVRDAYPEGIDEATNCKSTKLEPIVIPPPPSAAQQLEGVEDPYSMYDRSDPNGPWNRYLAAKSDEKLAYQKHLGFKARHFPPGDVLAARRKENALKKHRELMAIQNPEAPLVIKKKVGYNVVAGKKVEKKVKKFDLSSSDDEEEDNYKSKAKQSNDNLDEMSNAASSVSFADTIEEEILSPPLTKPTTPISPLRPQTSFARTDSSQSNQPRLAPMMKTTSMMRNKTSPSTFELKAKYAVKKKKMLERK